jgi:hypothetical protein
VPAPALTKEKKVVDKLREELNTYHHLRVISI